MKIGNALVLLIVLAVLLAGCAQGGGILSGGGSSALETAGDTLKEAYNEVGVVKFGEAEATFNPGATLSRDAVSANATRKISAFLEEIAAETDTNGVVAELETFKFEPGGVCLSIGDYTGEGFELKGGDIHYSGELNINVKILGICGMAMSFEEDNAVAIVRPTLGTETGVAVPEGSEPAAPAAEAPEPRGGIAGVNKAWFGDCACINNTEDRTRQCCLILLSK